MAIVKNLKQHPPLPPSRYEIARLYDVYLDVQSGRTSDKEVELANEKYLTRNVQSRPGNA